MGKIRVEGANKRRFTSEQSTKNSSDSQRHTSFPRVFFFINEFKIEINLIKQKDENMNIILIFIKFFFLTMNIL